MLKVGFFKLVNGRFVDRAETGYLQQQLGELFLGIPWTHRSAYWREFSLASLAILPTTNLLQSSGYICIVPDSSG